MGPQQSICTDYTDAVVSNSAGTVMGPQQNIQTAMMMLYSTGNKSKI
jgi:hypothetical protein